MFSSAELAYLRIVAESGAADWPEQIEARFPNPAYRRKLRWGIRQKAIRSYDGWRLYLLAAERDHGLSLERSASGRGVPVYEDLLVAWLRRLRGRPAPGDPRWTDPPVGSEARR
jgi:hypothetical protein